jgi:hypothetical protein
MCLNDLSVHFQGNGMDGRPWGGNCELGGDDVEQCLNGV